MTKALRHFLPGLLILAVLILLLWPVLRTAPSIVPALRHARPVWLLAAIIAQVLVYAALAGVLWTGLRTLGHRVSRPYLLWTSFAFLFANRALPGPAVVGMATLVYLLKRKQVPAAVTQAVAATFYLTDYISFFTLGFAGLIILVVDHGLRQLHPWALAGAGGLIGAGCIAAWAAYRMPEQAARWVERMAGNLVVLRIKVDAPAAGEAIRAFYRRWQDVSSRKGTIAVASMWALGMHLAESLTLMTLAWALGAKLTFGLAATGYIVANLAAIVSFLPGGVGFYDAAMLIAFSRIGAVPLATSIAVTLLYRVLSMLVPLPAVTGVMREAVRSQR